MITLRHVIEWPDSHRHVPQLVWMVLGGPKLQSAGLVTMPRENLKIRTHVGEETTFRLAETQPQFIEFLSCLRYCLTDVLPQPSPQPDSVFRTDRSQERQT